MAEAAREGSVYSLALRDGRPAHYWVVLNEPDPRDGRFIAVSFTDRHNLPMVGDIWPYQAIICSGLRLSKPSVLALQYAVVRTQAWLDQFGAELLGVCGAEALARARCNLHWYRHLLSPAVVRIADQCPPEWRDHCGPAPSGRPRAI